MILQGNLAGSWLNKVGCFANLSGSLEKPLSPKLRRLEAWLFCVVYFVTLCNILGSALELDISAKCATIVQSRNLNPYAEDADEDDWMIPTDDGRHVPQLPETVSAAIGSTSSIGIDPYAIPDPPLPPHVYNPSSATGSTFRPLPIDLKNLGSVATPSRRASLSPCTALSAQNLSRLNAQSGGRSPRRDWRTLVLATFTFFDPASEAQALGALKAYQGREEVLYSELQAKFKVTPTKEADVLRRWRQRQANSGKPMLRCCTLCNKTFKSAGGLARHYKNKVCVRRANRLADRDLTPRHMTVPNRKTFGSTISPAASSLKSKAAEVSIE